MQKTFMYSGLITFLKTSTEWQGLSSVLFSGLGIDRVIFLCYSAGID